MQAMIRGAAVAVLILALAFMGGCAGFMFVDPGPNPAYLTLPVQAQIMQAQVDAVIDEFGGPLFLKFSPRADTISGPFWDVQAFILAPDGGVHQLHPAPGGAILSQEGLSVDGQARFLAPPGKHKLRLVLSGLLLHTFVDERGFWKRYIPLVTRYSETEAQLDPGRELILDDLLHPR